MFPQLSDVLKDIRSFLHFPKDSFSVHRLIDSCSQSGCLYSIKGKRYHQGAFIFSFSFYQESKIPLFGVPQRDFSLSFIDLNIVLWPLFVVKEESSGWLWGGQLSVSAKSLFEESLHKIGKNQAHCFQCRPTPHRSHFATEGTCS